MLCSGVCCADNSSIRHSKSHHLDVRVGGIGTAAERCASQCASKRWVPRSGGCPEAVGAPNRWVPRIGGCPEAVGAPNRWVPARTPIDTAPGAPPSQHCWDSQHPARCTTRRIGTTARRWVTRCRAELASWTQVADALVRSDALGSASHLKVLHQAGLIEEVPELAKDRRERWWRLVSPSTRWSRAEFAHDPSAVTPALAAESVTLQRQFERASDWLTNAESAGDWDAAAFATQTWLTLSPEELAAFGEELIAVAQRWRHRAIPDDQATREPVFMFARAFPAQP
jgi:hypothetical protein